MSLPSVDDAISELDDKGAMKAAIAVIQYFTEFHDEDCINGADCPASKSAKAIVARLKQLMKEEKPCQKPN